MSFAVAHPAVLLVGCGKMGGALLHGWLDRGIPASSITVVEPDQMRARAATDRSVAVVADAADLESAAPDVVVLAIKPQSVEVVAPHYARFAAAGAVVLSIAAGRTIAGLVACLGPRAAVVRAMPNTPAAVRRGITVACANAAVGATQRAVCQDLLAAVGAVLWIDDEALMDAVTAVSGSGPAYVFLLAECLAQAESMRGCRRKWRGGWRVRRSSDRASFSPKSDAPPEVLRRDVTSPGYDGGGACGVDGGRRSAGPPPAERSAPPRDVPANSPADRRISCPGCVRCSPALLITSAPDGLIQLRTSYQGHSGNNKMAPEDDASDRMIKAALALASERGWRNVSLADMVARAELPLLEAYQEFSSKTAVLLRLVGSTDRAALSQGPAAASDPPRDRLFDVLIAASMLCNRDEKVRSPSYATYHPIRRRSSALRRVWRDRWLGCWRRPASLPAAARDR